MFEKNAKTVARKKGLKCEGKGHRHRRRGKSSPIYHYRRPRGSLGVVSGRQEWVDPPERCERHQRKKEINPVRDPKEAQAGAREKEGRLEAAHNGKARR